MSFDIRAERLVNIDKEVRRFIGVGGYGLDDAVFGGIEIKFADECSFEFDVEEMNSHCSLV